LRGYLREGLENGELTPCDPTSATRAILGSVEWTFSWLHQIPREQVSEVAQQALDIFAHGLFAGKARYQPIALPEAEHEDETQLAGFNRDEQNRQKQQAFYKTGTWFFNKQGFAGTSLDEIAEHLNVSKGAFYYHIKNKEDLLYSCYDYSLDIMENIHRQTDGIDYSGLQKVDHVCRRTFQVQNSEQGPLIRYNTITSLPIKRRKRILQRTEASNDRFGEFLRQGIADGSVRDINVFVAENLIAGAINAAMDIDLWRAVDDIDSAAKDYFDLFYNGLLPRNG
jgi:AcrR family transcriptional regulator